MNLEKTLKGAVLVGLFLIPIVPLVITNSLFFPFITGKAFAFRIIVGLIFFLWVGLVLLNKDYLPKRSLILYSLAVFLGVMSLATLLGVNSYRSFWSTFERMEGLITLLHLSAFFLILSSVFDEKWWWRFFHISLGVSLVVSFYGLFQLLGFVNISQGGARIDGTMGNAIYLAVYMLFHIFISLYYFFQRTDSYKYIYLVLMAFQSFILYSTATRGVILALLGGITLTFLLIFFSEKENRRFKKISGGIILAIIVIIAGFILVKDSQFVRKSSVLGRFSELSWEQVKTQGRFFIWPMAIEGFKQKPILGYGPENFVDVFSEHYDARMYGHEPWFDRVHNIYLDWLIAGGILGLLSFILIFIFYFRALWKSDKLSRVSKNIFVGLMAAYLLQGVFDFDNLTSYLLFFSVLAYVNYLQSTEQKHLFSFKKLSRKAVANFILPVLIVVFLILGYFAHYKPIMASRTLILGIDNQGSAEEDFEHFNRFFSYDTFGNQEGIIQLLFKTIQVIGNDTPEKLKENFFDLAEERISMQTTRFPKDTRVFTVVGNFYNQLGQYDTALIHLEKARNLSPTKQSIYFEIVNSLFLLGRADEALETAKFALELESENNEAKIVYALTLIITGQEEKANEVLETLPEDLIYFEDRFLNFYIQTSQNQKVLQIWKKRVEANKGNVDYRKSLVAAYLILEKWNEAVRELENIVEVDPTFKETADYAIAEINAGRGKSLLSN